MYNNWDDINKKCIQKKLNEKRHHSKITAQQSISKKLKSSWGRNEQAKRLLVTVKKTSRVPAYLSLLTPRISKKAVKSMHRATNLTAFTKVIPRHRGELFAARPLISCRGHEYSRSIFFLEDSAMPTTVAAPIIKHPLRARRHTDNALIVSWNRGKPATSINFSHTFQPSGHGQRPSNLPIVVQTCSWEWRRCIMRWLRSRYRATTRQLCLLTFGETFPCVL